MICAILSSCAPSDPPPRINVRDGGKFHRELHFNNEVFPIPINGVNLPNGGKIRLHTNLKDGGKVTGTIPFNIIHNPEINNMDPLESVEGESGDVEEPGPTPEIKGVRINSSIDLSDVVFGPDVALVKITPKVHVGTGEDRITVFHGDAVSATPAQVDDISMTMRFPLEHGTGVEYRVFVEYCIELLDAQNGVLFEASYEDPFILD